MSYSYTINVYDKDMHKPAESTPLDLPFFCDDAQSKKLDDTLFSFRKQAKFFVIELVEDKKAKRFAFGKGHTEDDYLEVVSEMTKFKERAHMNAFFGSGNMCPAH